MTRRQEKKMFILLSLVLVCAAEGLAQNGNPFAPLGGDPLPPSSAGRLTTVSSGPRLEALIWHRDKPVAILDGDLLTVGSQVNGREVVAVGREALVLKGAEGQEGRLRMPSQLLNRDIDETSGDTVSLNVNGGRVRDVLEALAYQAGLNLIYTADPALRIDLFQQGVTLDEALQAVCRAGSCALLRKEMALEVIEATRFLQTEMMLLNHAKARALEVPVTKLLSEGGTLGVDERLNALVVTDTQESLQRIRESVQALDGQAPQVLIDVLIVNVKLTDELRAGIDWQVIGRKTGTTNEGVTLTQELNGTALSNPFGSVSAFFIDGQWSFNMLLDMVRNRDDVTVLASPQVLVLNNQTASIDSVEEIPYQELSQTGNGQPIGTTAFKEAGVKLRVTPQIAEDGTIILHIQPEQSARTGTFTVDGTDTPIIETRKAETILRVKDGQTVIIGGLRKKEPFRKESRIPLLGDLPLLGKLFQKIHLSEIESELGVFITPRIYRDGAPEGVDLALVPSGDDPSSLWNKQVLKD